MRFRHWALIGGGLLAGCATEPSGPGVLVLPGAGKTFEQFREEDAVCRNYAQDRVGTTPEQAADDSVASSAGTGALWAAPATPRLAPAHMMPGLVPPSMQGMGPRQEALPPGQRRMPCKPAMTSVTCGAWMPKVTGCPRRRALRVTRCRHHQTCRPPGYPIRHCPKIKPPERGLITTNNLIGSIAKRQ